MNNFAIPILDFSNCWVSDRHITDDFQAVVKAEEFDFVGLNCYGIYQDFEQFNQQIPGFAALRFHFVVRRAPILC